MDLCGSAFDVFNMMTGVVSTEFYWHMFSLASSWAWRRCQKSLKMMWSPVLNSPFAFHLITHSFLSLNPLCWSALPVNRLRLAPTSFRCMLPGVSVNLLRYGSSLTIIWMAYVIFFRRLKQVRWGRLGQHLEQLNLNRVDWNGWLYIEDLPPR